MEDESNWDRFKKANENHLKFNKLNELHTIGKMMGGFAKSPTKCVAKTVARNFGVSPLVVQPSQHLARISSDELARQVAPISSAYSDILAAREVVRGVEDDRPL